MPGLLSDIDPDGLLEFFDLCNLVFSGVVPLRLGTNS